MQQRIAVRVKPFANLARLPGVFGRFHGHVDEHGRADNVGLRDKAPVAAVVGVVAIIAQHEIAARGNGHRAVIIVSGSGGSWR